MTTTFIVPAPPPAGARAEVSRASEQEPTAPAPHGTDPSEALTWVSDGEPCPHCTNGSYTRRTGPLRWQVQTLRCAFCHGTGRINPEGDA